MLPFQDGLGPAVACQAHQSDTKTIHSLKSLEGKLKLAHSFLSCTENLILCMLRKKQQQHKNVDPFKAV
jgi:hypothetical protein